MLAFSVFTVLKHVLHWHCLLPTHSVEANCQTISGKTMEYFYHCIKPSCDYLWIPQNPSLLGKFHQLGEKRHLGVFYTSLIYQYRTTGSKLSHVVIDLQSIERFLPWRKWYFTQCLRFDFAYGCDNWYLLRWFCQPRRMGHRQHPNLKMDMDRWMDKVASKVRGTSHEGYIDIKIKLLIKRLSSVWEICLWCITT